MIIYLIAPTGELLEEVDSNLLLLWLRDSLAEITEKYSDKYVDIYYVIKHPTRGNIFATARAGRLIEERFYDLRYCKFPSEVLTTMLLLTN